MRDQRDGPVKIATGIARLLNFRLRHPALFAEGVYQTITIYRADSKCAIGFLFPSERKAG